MLDDERGNRSAKGSYAENHVVCVCMCPILTMIPSVMCEILVFVCERVTQVDAAIADARRNASI